MSIQKVFKSLRGQRGFTLLEVLIAVSILAAIGVVIMTSLSTAYKSVGIMDEQQQAELLIRSQLEDIKNSLYRDDGVYPVTVTLPPEYSMAITVTPPTQIGTLDNNTPLEELVPPPVTTIQEITVSVHRGNKPVLSVACYKVKQ